MDFWVGMKFRLSDFALLKFSSILMLIGLFTLSWERFGNVPVLGYNIKLSVACFSASLLFSLVDLWRAKTPLRIPKIVVFSLGLVLFFGLFSLIAVNPFYGLLQTITVLLGAVVPLWAVLLNLKLYPLILRALNAVIYGAVFASVFGLYQLFAFYTELPQIVTYTATDASGYGRISSFSYESGYFGYFLILAMTAVIARSVYLSQPVSQVLLGFLGLTLVLTNSRAAFVTVPILVILFILFWPRSTARIKIGWLISTGISVFLLVIVLLPNLVFSLFERFTSIFDPNEKMSNAPRLGVLEVGWQIFIDNPILGIGPSSFRDFLSKNGFPVSLETSPNAYIANNIWLQAALDGGLILLTAQILFVISVVYLYFSRKNMTVWVLLSGWITVLFVSSFVTSYFWDIKLWVFLGLAVAISHISGTAPPMSRQHSFMARKFKESPKPGTDF